MILNKIKHRSLFTNDDLRYNEKLGLPVEVFCTMQNTTVAFGQIESFSNLSVSIANTCYNRKQFVFFGHQPVDHSTL
ncbi:hypothetical protein ACFPU1_15640 [Thalassorhabdus alkalitolerans]|uniref:Uncharacterized protein n=1 Tax=Thalassorhabdus alkalitolerans TaxID=2282697 RepID=A0ABW0YRS9_9BACI|nr:hypothetical protein [Thalassobacillus sp. C254]